MKEKAYKIKYGGGELPEDLFALLENADETDLKILIALLMSSDSEGIVNIDPKPQWAASVEEGELSASLKFWKGAGVISKAAAPSGVKTASQAKSLPETTAHRNGAVERVTGIATYQTSELARLMEERRVTAEYLDAAQRILGKTFNTYDTGIMAGFIDQLELEEEAVLAIVSYCVKLGKKSIKYIEKTVFAFYDEGLTTATAINKKIDDIERSNDTVYKIRALFGAEDREPSAKEKKLFKKWTLDMGYGIEVIRMAYDITIDTIHEPSPSYAGGILDNWHGEGLKNVEEIEAYLERSRAKKSEAALFGDGKSYDTDDFFEAAMNRSYDKMKK